MKDERSSQQNIIKGWSFQNLLLEFYRYAPAPAEWELEHYHEEYQFCLSIDCPGEYYYRGTHYWVPNTSISIIHPGEIHKGRDIDNRQIPATFKLMYISPKDIATTVTDITGKNVVPFFAEPIIVNAELAQQFQDFHTASQSASILEQEKRLLVLIAHFLRYSEPTTLHRAIGSERLAVQQVRDYLKEHYNENTSLAYLAEVANLSPYYLSRVFHAEVGISLRDYQILVRIEQAKKLLAKGITLQQVAAETGFVDQSHLTRQFKRVVRVTPGSYARRNKAV